MAINFNIGMDELERRRQALGIQPIEAEQSQSQNENGGWKSWISEAGGVLGGIGGGLVGSVVPGAGTVVGGITGATLGAGIGQALESKLLGKKITAGDIAKESLYSGAGEIAGFGLAKIAGKVLPRLAGKVIAGQGERIALKGLRPSKTQVLKFEEGTGKKLVDFVIDKNLFKAGTAEVDDLIKPLQTQYDNLAVKSGKKIKPSVLYNAFDKRIGELKNIPNSTAQSIATQLEDEGILLYQKYGKNEIDIGDITKLRRNIDELVSPKAFQADPIAAGKNKNVRDLLKSVIDDSTGGETRKLGNELRDLYAFRDIAEIQEGLGKGSLPMGLTQLLSIGGGGIVGGGIGYGGGRDTGSTLTGALIGMGFTSAANNPKVVAYLAKNMISKGGKLAIKEPSKTGMLATGSLGAGVGSAISGQESFDEGITTATENALPSISQQTQQTSGSLSGEDISMLMMEDLIKTGGKNIPELKIIYEMMSSQAKPKTEAQVARDDTISLAQSALQDIQSQSIKTGMISGPLEQFKGKFGAADQSTLEFNSKIAMLKGAIAKARAGTSFTPNEEKLLNQYTPTVGDSRQQIITKLNGLVQFFSQRPESNIVGNDYNQTLPNNLEQLF